MRRILIFVIAALLCAFCAVGCVANSEAPHHGEHEYLSDRPSGFWTSNAPAVGGAYKYRLMLVGLGVLVITGVLTYRLVRNARPRS